MSKQTTEDSPAAAAAPSETLPGIKHVVAVASAKGGVGKTTVTVNLAMALRDLGMKVGIADADILGPSVHTMVGDTAEPQADHEQGRMIPPEKHGVKVISMGMLTGHDQPAILRGPMVTQYMELFIRNVSWGELDCLLIDLPPGTGDTQLSLAQRIPLSGAVIVTTPQEVSLNIARRGLRMFERLSVPILGILENMSGFVCPHCGERTDVFRSGGGAQMGEQLKLPFLGALPLDPGVVTSGDEGRPVVEAFPDSPTTASYRTIADRLMARLDSGRAGGLGAFAWNWRTDDGVPQWLESAVRDDGQPTVPVGMRRAGPKTLEILWEDGASHQFDVRDLRIACPCAACNDEMSGEPLVDPSTIAMDVEPREVTSVGRYALSVNWSDGHSTGIYDFIGLREYGDRHLKAVKSLEV
jgi:ATP-binding protein involved in chromosome partitioning